MFAEARKAASALYFPPRDRGEGAKNQHLSDKWKKQAGACTPQKGPIKKPTPFSEENLVGMALEETGIGGCVESTVGMGQDIDKLSVSAHGVRIELQS